MEHGDRLERNGVLNSGVVKSLLAALCSALLILGSTGRPLRGQSRIVSASLGGAVVDSSGAAIPDAVVTLTDLEHGVSQPFHTGPDGRYNFPSITAGNYALTVEKPGFKIYNQSGIVLLVGQAASADVVMQVGGVTQQVSVVANAEALSTRDTNIGSDLTSRDVMELPLNLREPLSLALTNSSVNNAQFLQAIGGYGGGGSGANADQDTGFLNFGGGRFGTIAMLMDGHWDGAGDWDGLQYAPALDEVQELKIQTNTFSAQYGWSMGNVINMATKGGTNAFHGDAFDFMRTSPLDANQWFNDAANVPKESYHRNQFGASAGGPIYIPHLYEQRNKTFVFGLYEGRRVATPTNNLTTVPTAPMRTGDFSALLGTTATGTDALGRPYYPGEIYNPYTSRNLTVGETDPVTGLVAQQSGWIRDPFPGNIIPPPLLNPVAQAAIKYYPAPTNNGLANNFFGAAVVPVLTNEYSIRVDHNISDKSRLFGRWSQKGQTETATAPFFGANDPAGPGSEAPDNRWDFGFGYTRVFSPTFIMNLTYGRNRWVEGRVTQNNDFDVTTLGLPSYLNLTSAGKGCFPSFGIGGSFFNTAGDYSLGQGGCGNSFPRETASYAIDISKNHGHHMLSLGFMWINFLMRNANFGQQVGFGFDPLFTDGPNPQTQLATTGYSVASFMLGTGDSGGITVAAEPDLFKNMYGAYIQDDWTVKPGLTVNLGLRYDFQPSADDKFNRAPWLNLSATNPIQAMVSGISTPGELVYPNSSHPGLYNPPHDNFYPRVGFAYTPLKKLVVRGGFGIFDTQSIEIDVFRGWPLSGYSPFTPFVGSLPGQYTPVNTLSNPFPGGLLPATNNTAGGLTLVGEGADGIQFQSPRPTPYVEQWMMGFQYAVTANDMVEANYVGNHGVKLTFGSGLGSGGIDFDQLPDKDLSLGNALLAQVPNPFYGVITSSGCGLASPTVAYGQLLRPHPQYCSLTSDQMVGAQSYYDALQFNYNHRWHGGLQTLVSFTASKYLDDTAGNESWATSNSANFQDYDNYAAEKSLDGSDTPRSLVISYIYALPFGHGKHYGSNVGKPANALLGGWQVSGISTFKSGFPLSFSQTTNSSNSFDGGQRPNVTGNPEAAHPTVNQWLNPTVFSVPAPFTFGDESRYDPHARAPGTNNWDITASKWFNIERVRTQFRWEIYNLANHGEFYAPDTTFGSPAFGTIARALPSRSMQVALKLYW
jgi:hypothetical protein